jgi:hypothetical protein
MFYKIVTKNPAMNGTLAEEKKREMLKDTEYVQVMFNFHGMREYAWYPRTQLQPTEPPDAWFGEPVKQH